MECFEFLGIVPTNDVKAIRRAYSKLLPNYSPETDPEGFKNLRAAYEAALAKANEKEDKIEKPLSPVDKFMSEFNDTYRCFEKRLDIKIWKELLDRDICCNIETSKQISKKILTFIMKDYNFPSEIWSLFDSYFSWSTKRDKLCSEFPGNFIDFVIYNVRHKGSFHYECLNECSENKQDDFISEYNNAISALEDYDLYHAKASIKTASEISKDNPDLLILKARFLMTTGHMDESYTLFTEVISKYSDNFNTYFYRGDLLYRTGKIAKAYEDYKMALTINPESSGTLYWIGKCCICLEKYKEAVKYLEKLIETSQYNIEVKRMLDSAYNFYIDNLNECLEKNSEDTNTKFELANALFKTEKFEQCLKLLDEIKESCEFSPEMYLLYCQTLLVLKKYELAYTTICKAVDLFNDNYDLNFCKASILDDFGKLEEALTQYDKTLTLNNNSAIVYNNKGYVLNKLKRYNEALECENRALSINPNMAHSYKNKAEALLNLELFEDCLNACEQALNIYQYLTDVYVIKMKVFIKINFYDDALRTYSKAYDLGLKDVRLYNEKAQVLRLTKKFDASIDYCNSVLEVDDKNGDAYYCKGLCYYNKKEYDNSINCLNKAIEYNSNISVSYYHKAQCFLNTSKESEALDVINTAIEMKVEFLDNFYNLKGAIFSKQEKYAQAFAEFKKAIDYEPAFACYYYSAGHSLNELNRFKEAADYLKKALELNPSDLDCYISLSYSFYSLSKFDECIDYCKKIIEIDPDSVTAHQNMGWSFYRLSKIQEAEDACNIALKLNGNNPDILLLKLRILMHKGISNEALIVCDRMLELNPDDEIIKNIKNDLINRLGKNKPQKKGLFKSLFG